MREIKHTRQFRRDYKRVKKSSHHRGTIDTDIMVIVKLLIADKPLPVKNYDHPLCGEWKDHRDCHVKPDLVLIYRKPTPDRLELVRIGSHSELGLSG